MRCPTLDPHSTAQLVADINCIASFLAADDFESRQPDPSSLNRALGAPVADVLVLLGNSVLHTMAHAFAAMTAGAAHHLLICGGLGHSTRLLHESLQADPRYRTIVTDGRSEADLLAEMAVRFHGIAPEMIAVETESTNCGENARFALRTLKKEGIANRTILLVQDPTMQLRSAASFAKTWRDDDRDVTLANYPTFVPQVDFDEDHLVFADAQVKGLWPMERFVSLLLGEIPRLRDDANGYGPKGRGFIDHVDIPQNVLNAHTRLLSLFPTFVR